MQELSTGCSAIAHAPYALGGTLLTPSGPTPGYVVVQNERIAAVVADRASIPAGVTNVVETGGIVSPGLVDLHNHVAYNFLPLWNAGRRFNNRYQWARLAAYRDAVKEPYNAVKGARRQCDAIKYGELRALAGGTTTIQGSVDLACTRSWARNVEFGNFCADHVRQNVLAISSISASEARTLNAQFASGKTKAFLVHLAEGIDASSSNELEQLKNLDLLKPQVVGIHSTGLTEAQLHEMGQAGMKIVWSPLSNMILYGQTTKIPIAIREGIKVALAPDWTPSGSANLLAELKMADRVNKTQFNSILTDRDLYEMATKNPAEIVGLDDKLGSIAVGKAADLMVVRGDAANPYRAVIDAKPADVLLTTVGGQVFYGDEALVSQTGSTRFFEDVDACGEHRVISSKDPSNIPEANRTLSDMTTTMLASGATSIVPLFDCDTTKFDFAFATSP
ncbi:MAG: amidohydrolase family protein [Labilithrix sp.]|nr:amidohydrolase family protein [Labilithrix sp.]MCW5809779.1 amidohydrolase family protein [Labilithrix sp.]